MTLAYLLLAPSAAGKTHTTNHESNQTSLCGRPFNDFPMASRTADRDLGPSAK